MEILREPFTATEYDKHVIVIATGNGQIVQDFGRRKTAAIQLARDMNEAFKLGYDSGFKNGKKGKKIAFDF